MHRAGRRLRWPRPTPITGICCGRSGPIINDGTVQQQLANLKSNPY
jgi:hypothetical protein